MMSFHMGSQCMRTIVSHRKPNVFARAQIPASSILISEFNKLQISSMANIYTHIIVPGCYRWPCTTFLGGICTPLTVCCCMENNKRDMLLLLKLCKVFNYHSSCQKSTHYTQWLLTLVMPMRVSNWMYRGLSSYAL